jgi:hypothetical protein
MGRKKSDVGRPTSMAEAVVEKLEVAFSVGTNVTEGWSRWWEKLYRLPKEDRR